jgi:peptide deformylase
VALAAFSYDVDDRFGYVLNLRRPGATEGTGEPARCLQHETDHLRGELYIDALTGERRRDAMRMLRRAPARARSPVGES